jgi:hypothetical protein
MLFLLFETEPGFCCAKTDGVMTKGIIRTINIAKKNKS